MSLTKCPHCNHTHVCHVDDDDGMTPDTAALRSDATHAARRGLQYINVRTGIVIALCDAADEVERLRNPDIATPREREALLTVERMVTAHAALVADLRALHTGPNPPIPDGIDRGAFLLGWEQAHEDVESLLDRHAPKEGS